MNFSSGKPSTGQTGPGPWAAPKLDECADVTGHGAPGASWGMCKGRRSFVHGSDPDAAKAPGEATLRRGPAGTGSESWA